MSISVAVSTHSLYVPAPAAPPLCAPPSTSPPAPASLVIAPPPPDPPAFCACGSPFEPLLDEQLVQLKIPKSPSSRSLSFCRRGLALRNITVQRRKARANRNYPGTLASRRRVAHFDTSAGAPGFAGTGSSAETAR